MNKSEILKLVLVIIILITGIIVVAVTLVSASVTCDKSSIDNQNTQLTCTNTGSSTVIITKVGSYFSINKQNINPNMTETITLIFDSNAPVGNLGAILFDSSQPVQVNNNQAPVTCNLNPSLSSFTQAMQQNTQFTMPKITFSPQNCQGEFILDASHIRITGGVIIGGIQKPVSITSIVSDGVNLVIDTTNLNTQTYNSNIEINAYGKNFQIPINIVVTSGASPSTNVSLDNLPVCSLTSTVLNLNSTYSLVCTGIQPDVALQPVIDDSYIIGNGLETTSSQIIWYFKPIKFGNTLIKAKFTYRGYPFGTPYSQEVKITSSGSSIPGTTLKLITTPSLENAFPNQPVILQIIDNKSNSLVENPQIYMDALPLSPNGTIFTFKFKSDTTYNFRAKVNGYDDLVLDLKLLTRPLNITISPISGNTKTLFTISPSDLNANLFIDGSKVNSTYVGYLQAGTHEIRAIGEGFVDAVVNLTITSSPSAYLITEFKKDVPQVISLNQNMSWELDYTSDLNSAKTILLTGNSDKIQFTPDKVGFYTVYSNSTALISPMEIKGFDWNAKWWILPWWVWILIAVLIIIVIYVRAKKSRDQVWSGNVNT